MKNMNATYFLRIGTVVYVLYAVIGMTQLGYGSATYSYDCLNRVTSVEYPNGYRIEYTYDTVGNRTSYLATAAGARTEESMSLANGMAQQISISSLGTTGATYEWYRHGEKISTTNDPRLAFPGFSPSDAGAYRVIIRDASGAVSVVDLAVQITGLTYEAWLRDRLGDAADPQDPGLGRSESPLADGVTNLFKYGVGGAPYENASDRMPQASLVEFGGKRYSALTVTRIFDPGDVHIRIEGSEDLVFWTDVSADLIPMGSPQYSADGFTEQVTFRCPYPLEDSRAQEFRFLRMVVDSNVPVPFLSRDPVRSSTFVIEGPSGFRIGIERSPDGENWTRISLMTIPASGQMSYSDQSGEAGGYYRIAWSTSEVPLVVDPRFLPGEGASFFIVGPACFGVIVERSTDLKRWTTLSSVVIPDSGVLSYVDPEQLPSGYYRLRWDAPEEPRIVSLTQMESGGASFFVVGPGGLQIDVMRSLNLADWTQLSTEVIPASGILPYHDQELHSAAYYRVRWVALEAAITLEAEDGLVSAPFMIGDGAVWQEVETTDPGDGGLLRLDFEVVAAGAYTIRVLVDAPNAGADSFFLNIDTEPVAPEMIWDIIPLTNGLEDRLVNWRGSGAVNDPEFAPKSFVLSAGSHTLYIRGREANTKINRIVIE
jgi:YD repeat-containing protein